jgi:hypothetical protein
MKHVIAVCPSDVIFGPKVFHADDAVLLFELALDLCVLDDVGVVADNPLGHPGYLNILAAVVRPHKPSVNHWLVLLDTQLLDHTLPTLCCV